jgi:hypothetical protein
MICVGKLVLKIRRLDYDRRFAFENHACHVVWVEGRIVREHLPGVRSGAKHEDPDGPYARLYDGIQDQLARAV